ARRRNADVTAARESRPRQKSFWRRSRLRCRFFAMRETPGTLVRSLLWLVLTACGSSGGSGGDLVSIDVEPANATLTYTGSPVSVDYKAIGHFADGSTAELPDAVFSLD